ncbi:hypothetical protein AAFF_G00117070 [Aldrovandia affinis]|uniref:Reverse transcriptase domain-containing protein n=1 Tax=Aldrovandia affinis TaxID=143900 RepID=A0AAD7T1Q4_9TELE|nr:hypothetical protein AAFF_G00117070 [Aldrovandia affinis]
MRMGKGPSPPPRPAPPPGIDQEKAFDRVQHGFLFGVLGRMGFGPRFIGWVRTLYAVNGFLSGAVEQAGVRQGCPLSPLLYVLFMEPFAELVRRDPGVDGVRVPGAAGEVLKIQQYAGRIRALTDLFGAGTGSRVNMAKSSVLFCGSWTEDMATLEGLRCVRGTENLGRPVLGSRSAAQNWKARLTSCAADLLRQQTVLERAPHKCFFLARFYLAGFFRHLVVLSHVVPRADVRSPAYKAVARLFRQGPPSISRAEALDHRALYARLACRQVVVPSGVPARHQTLQLSAPHPPPG